MIKHGVNKPLSLIINILYYVYYKSNKRECNLNLIIGSKCKKDIRTR